MDNSQRFLVALLFTLGAFSLLILSSQVNHQMLTGDQVFPQINTNLAAEPAATTVTVTSTLANSQAFPTKLSLAISSNSIRQNQRVTLTLTLIGQNQGQNASLPNQLVAVTSTWGSTVNCVTQNDGTCRLDINAPSSSGNYVITAKYSGNIFFASSTATANLKVQ